IFVAHPARASVGSIASAHRAAFDRLDMEGGAEHVRCHTQTPEPAGICAASTETTWTGSDHPGSQRGTYLFEGRHRSAGPARALGVWGAISGPPSSQPEARAVVSDVLDLVGGQRLRGHRHRAVEIGGRLRLEATQQLEQVLQVLT